MNDTARDVLQSALFRVSEALGENAERRHRYAAVLREADEKHARLLRQQRELRAALGLEPEEEP